MIPIQPTKLHCYLTNSAQPIPSEMSHYFYQSWEDALWDLLIHFAFPKGSVVLVPSFFCGDVIDNMAAHGLQAVFYEVDRNFQTSPKVFREALLQHTPDIVVILHAVGITNRLFSLSKEWRDALPDHALLIEDSVHRVVNPATLHFLTNRHVVMDSLRKVLPLAGSNLFAPKTLQMKMTPGSYTLPYQIAVVGWWFIFQLCLLCSTTGPRLWRTLWNRLAETTMLRGYDVIGDSYQSGKGWQLFKLLARRLNYPHIQSVKQRHVQLYSQHLADIWQNTAFFSIHFPETDAGLLRGFPLGLKQETADQVLKMLRDNGLLVRFELNDSPWARLQKVVYLPIGPHLSDQQIVEVAQLVRKVALSV